MTKRLSESLEVAHASAPPMVRCSRCKHVLSKVTEDWKTAALVRERAVSAAVPLMRASKRFSLREFACPRCLTLLDTEIVFTKVRRIQTGGSR